MNIVLDFETTGLNTETARPIEIGIAVVDDSWNTRYENSFMIYDPSYPVLSKEIEELTHISQTALIQASSFATVLDGIWKVINEFSFEYVIAYNSQYDQAIWKAEADRQMLHMHPMGNLLGQLPWICAMRDVKMHQTKKCWVQSHLALDYGIPVDPAKLHSALGDVQLLVQLLKKVNVPAKEIYAYQQEETVVLQAQIPGPWLDGGKGKDEARKLGYSWETPKGSDEKYEKMWVKQIKISCLEEEIGKASFKVQQLK